MPSEELSLPDRILVVGGCGFLGHHIVRQLLDAGVKHVSVLDLRTERNRQSGATYHSGDITSAADVEGVLAKEKPVALIHTASPIAAAHVPNAVYDKVNVQGTRTLLECAGRSKTVKAFVYTSSASVVHDYVNDLRFASEDRPVLHIPETPDYYSHTKAVAEDEVLATNRKHGSMLTASIRPAGIFGEGDAQMIPGAVGAYLSGKTRVQIGDNTNLWDYTYVGNVAYAHLLAVQALMGTLELKVQPLDFERVDGEAFFITNDEPAPFWDFMRRIWTEAGWKDGDKKPWVMPAQMGLFIAYALNWIVWLFTFGRKVPSHITKGMIFSTQARTFSIEKAKRRLGYEPQTPLEEGIRRGVAHYMKTLEAEKGKKDQ